MPDRSQLHPHWLTESDLQTMEARATSRWQDTSAQILRLTAETRRLQALARSLLERLEPPPKAR
jgi:hypothetical protein